MPSAPRFGPTDWRQPVTLQVPATGKTIHLRLHLPPHPVAIDTVTLKDATSTATWKPGKN